MDFINNVDFSGFRKLYPFESRFFEIGPCGLKYHYIDEGSPDKPPVVMVHGNPTWSFYYRNVVKALSVDYRAVAVDHIGCGASDKPQDYSYTLENHISNLENLINHLNLKDITLIMHDWGGAIGMGYAVRHPENIKKIIILNTAAFTFPDMPFRIRICRIPVFGDIAVRCFNAFAGAAIYMATAKHERMTPDVKAGYLAPYDNYNNRIATLRFVQDIPMSPEHTSYAALLDIENKLCLLKNKPMLSVFGAKDFCFTLEFMKKWKSFFPNADYRSISDAGHYVLEDSHELIIPWIRKFLN